MANREEDRMKVELINPCLQYLNSQIEINNTKGIFEWY